MFPKALARSILALSLAAIASFQLAATAATKSITVEAGELDRKDCLVTFPWKESDPKKQLRAADGRYFPLQADSKTGTASFVLDSLKAGESLTLQFETAGKSVYPHGAEARKNGTAIDLHSKGKAVLSYQTADTEVPRPEIKPVYRHNSYLHPILTPSGKTVTGDYPPDHLWHRGIWLAWTHTEFDGGKPDFWNQSKSDKLTARIDFDKLDSTWSGPVHSGVRASHKFLDSGKPVLNESWEVRAYVLPSSSKFHVIDLVSVQTCATDKPLKLPKYYYGGLGYRANPQWEQKDNVSFLISSGETDRVKMNEQRINWIRISGKTDGELTSITLMDHPENFRSPQPIRVNPKNPQTCFAPSQLGDWAIEPGKPLTSRYRFVVADGEPDKAELDRLWKDYAQPPKVTVK